MEAQQQQQQQQPPKAATDEAVDQLVETLRQNGGDAEAVMNALNGALQLQQNMMAAAAAAAVAAAPSEAAAAAAAGPPRTTAPPQFAPDEDGDEDGVHGYGDDDNNDDGDWRRRARDRKPPEVLAELERVFVLEPYIGDENKRRVLQKFPKLTERQLVSWFSHRRRKEKWEMEVYESRIGRKATRTELYTTPGARDNIGSLPRDPAAREMAKAALLGRPVAPHAAGFAYAGAGAGAGAGYPPPPPPSGARGVFPPPPPPPPMFNMNDPEILALVAHVKQNLQSLGGDKFREDGPPLGYFPPPGESNVSMLGKRGRMDASYDWSSKRGRMDAANLAELRNAERLAKMQQKQEAAQWKAEAKQAAREEKERQRVERDAERAKVREEKLVMREKEREERLARAAQEKRSRLEAMRMERKLRAAELPDDDKIDVSKALQDVRDQMVACYRAGGDVEKTFPAFAPLQSRAEADRIYQEAYAAWYDVQLRNNAQGGEDGQSLHAATPEPQKPGLDDPPGLPFVLPESWPENLPLPAFPPTAITEGLVPAFPESFDTNVCGETISIWSFVHSFRENIHMDSFTLEELVAALQAGTHSRLLCELHVCLLRHVQAEIEEAHLKRQEFGVQYNPELAAPCQLLEEAWAWGFDVDAWRAHLSVATWPEIMRQLALAAGQGPSRPRVAFPEAIEEGEVDGGLAANVKYNLPDHIEPGTAKAAAWEVLMEAGNAGMTLTELVIRVKQEYPDLKQARNPEASMKTTLVRDPAFVNVAVGTYALQCLLSGEGPPSSSKKSKKEKGGGGGGNAVIDAAKGAGAAPYHKFVILTKDDEEDDDDEDEEMEDDEEEEEEEEEDEEMEDANGVRMTKREKREEEKKQKKLEEEEKKKRERKKLAAETESEVPSDTSWVTKLSICEYDELSIEERVTALTFLINEAIGCNTVRFAIDEKGTTLQEVRRVWREESKQLAAAKKPGQGRGRGRGRPREHNDVDEDDDNDEDGGEKLGGAGATGRVGVMTPEERRLQSLERQRLIDNLSIRFEPLGRDRRGNRYWIISPSRSFGIAGMDRIYIERNEDNEGDLSLPAAWSVVADPKALRDMVACLDDRGRHEAMLKHSMGILVPEMVKEMKDHDGVSPEMWMANEQAEAGELVRYNGHASHPDDRWFYGPYLWACRRKTSGAPSGTNGLAASLVSPHPVDGSFSLITQPLQGQPSTSSKASKGNAKADPAALFAEGSDEPPQAEEDDAMHAWMLRRRVRLACRLLATIVGRCQDTDFASSLGFTGRGKVLNHILDLYASKGGTSVVEMIHSLRKWMFNVERGLDKASLSPSFSRDPSPTLAAFHKLIPTMEMAREMAAGNMAPIEEPEDLEWVPRTSAALTLRLMSLDAALAYGGMTPARAMMDAYRFIKRMVSVEEDGSAIAAAEAAEAEQIAKREANNERRRMQYHAQKNAAAAAATDSSWPSVHRGRKPVEEVFSLPTDQFRRELKPAEEELGLPGAITSASAATASKKKSPPPSGSGAGSSKKSSTSGSKKKKKK